MANGLYSDYDRQWYLFEEEVLGYREADESADSLHEFLLRVWPQYRPTPPPWLSFAPHPKSKFPCYYTTEKGADASITIHLPEGWRTRRVLAHELVHAILHQHEIYGGHYGTFAATYLDLLAAEYGFDYETLKAAAAQYDLAVCEPVARVKRIGRKSRRLIGRAKRQQRRAIAALR